MQCFALFVYKHSEIRKIQKSAKLKSPTCADFRCSTVLFFVSCTTNYKIITANVLNSTLEAYELVDAENTVDSNEQLDQSDVLIQDCESREGNCTSDPLENEDIRLCPEKYVYFDGKCVECDCGEAPCELDSNGTKLECNCSGTQKPYKGKCFTCVCGELSRLCYFDSKGGKQCVCLNGAADLLGTCTACSCGENSRSCLFNKEGGLVCYCKPGFSQKNDTCLESCKSSKDCLNGGACKKADGATSSFCVCPKDFSGGRCQVDLVCEALQRECDRMKAVCRRDRTKRYCECPAGQRLDHMSGACQDICDNTVCNHGFCVVKDLGFRCICKQGYSGVLCDEKIVQYRESPNNTISIIIFGIVCLAIVSFSIGTFFLKRRNDELLKIFHKNRQLILNKPVV